MNSIFCPPDCDNYGAGTNRPEDVISSGRLMFMSVLLIGYSLSLSSNCRFFSIISPSICP